MLKLIQVRELLEILLEKIGFYETNKLSDEEKIVINDFVDYYATSSFSYYYVEKIFKKISKQQGLSVEKFIEFYYKEEIELYIKLFEENNNRKITDKELENLNVNINKKRKVKDKIIPPI